MKVIALDPVPRGVRLVVFVGELGKANSPKVMLYVTYEFNEDEARPAGLAQIRTRLRTLFEKEKPDKVFVEPLEGHALRGANKRNVNIGWFESAESRGVAAETAHSATATFLSATAPKLRAPWATAREPSTLKTTLFGR